MWGDNYGRSGELQGRKALRGGPEGRPTNQGTRIMKLSFLIDFLEGRVSVSSLRDQFAEPLKKYREKGKVRGTSRPVVLYADLSDFTVRQEHVACLCDAYLAEQLDEAEVDYLGSGLQLVAASKEFYFETAKVEEDLSLLCDPEINGPLTKALVQKIRDSFL